MQHSRSLVNRMLRAARLEIALYEEVEADTRATIPALWVVVIASVAAGIGSGITGIVADKGAIFFLWGLLGGVAAALIGWVAWAGITYFLGTTILKGPRTSATWGELLRTIGFAQSPNVLKIISFIPFIGWLINLGASIWVLIATVIGVRQALDVSTGRAIAVCILGWLIYFVLGLLIAFLFGVTLRS
ncbi:MAG TPA: hypothetical protein EYP71_03365 [Dehalococcoidia bacterium]|nr:hypothetical protein [Dehalococcoidia bacterium]